MLRLIGLLFLAALVLLGVGYFRGWYSIGSVQAGGKSGLTIDIDKQAIGKDTVAAADKLAKLSAKAAEKIRNLAQANSAGRTTIEGRVEAVDANARTLRLHVGDDSIDLMVPADANVTRNGAATTLAQLQQGVSVRVTVQQQDAELRVASIEVMP